MPLRLGGSHKSDVRTQFAAMCYRYEHSKLQILLVTSRTRRRWIVPKGWPMDGKTASGSAAQEAWEEAGAVGRVDGRPLGIYSYVKETGLDAGMPCVVMVYALKVKSLAKKFPEVGQRKRQWVSRKRAAKLVAEPELARILRDFDPRHL
ncbi:MAG: NUDIX hydrolase [Pseudomonadota bacterium]